MTNKDKWERKNNIVFKGVWIDRIERELIELKDEKIDWKKWVMKFLEEKTRLEC